MSKLTMIVQGKNVNASVISAFCTRLNNLESVVSVWANAATLQVALHNNSNWLNSLFDAAPMRVKNGDLSALGKQVFKYIESHFPRVVWNKDTQKIGVKKFNAESPLATSFVVPNCAQETETIRLMGNKYYSAHGDFAMTFAEFKNIEKVVKEKDEDEAPKMTAKAFITQATKALECFKSERLVGTADELFAAATHAKALFLALDAAHSAAELAKSAKLAEQGIAAAGESAIDLGKMAESQNVKASSKSRAAGGKVKPEMAAA